MKKYLTSVLAASAMVVLISAGAGTAAAETEQAPMPSAPANAVEAPRALGTSQYVEAGSPAEATRLLDGLDSRSGEPSAAASSVQYGPCTLYPSNVYLRKSSGYGAVGFRPVTKCTVSVTSIDHDSDIRYKWYLWWRKGGSTHTGGNRVASYTQTNVEYYCTGTTKTTFSGTTLGTIIYGGRTSYARVYIPVASLNCRV